MAPRVPWEALPLPGSLRSKMPAPKAFLHSPTPFSALSDLLWEIALNSVLCSLEGAAGRRTACFLLQSPPPPAADLL